MTVPPDFTSSALHMLTALVIVLLGLGLIYLAAKRFLHRGLAGQGAPPIRVLASQYVGVKKNISLVEVPGAVLVVGMTNDRMSLLDKIDDPVLLDQLRVPDDPEAVGFSNQLSKLTDRLKALQKPH